jgi:NADH-quinone oxidoreductase subunit L
MFPEIIHVTYLIPIAPLVAAVLLVLFGKKLGDPASGYVATFSVLLSFILSAAVVGSLASVSAGHRFFEQSIFTFFNYGYPPVGVAFLLDPLSAVMILFVSGVSTLICWYSVGYMKNDPQFHKFFIYLTLFVASMLTLVLGANLLVTFIGWEGVGLCSYLLISFWFERPAAASAGKKAMIVNRVGDAGFLLAIFLTYSVGKTLDYEHLFVFSKTFSHGVLIAIVLLAFVGAIGKSAQLPLVGWLPDAMEGPTPVSALIHAATMVTAGVYLMVRLSPLLASVPVVAHIIAIVGIITAAFGALSGSAQNDIKKVLAYSTVSQLGFMFIAVGTGAYVAAIFLMVAHSFYKACLFLSAGSVIHAMDEEQDIKKMGGLRKFLPITTAAFFIGWMAIGGIFPLSGFWAKRSILLHAYEVSFYLWLATLLTALLTAYYIGREFCLVFLGQPRWGNKSKKHLSPHEPGLNMKIPTVTLAVFAVFGGLLQFNLGNWLNPALKPLVIASSAGSNTDLVLSIADAIIAAIGAYVAFALWKSRSFNKTLEPAFLANAFYYDYYVDKLIARSATYFAKLVDNVVETKTISYIVKGATALAAYSGDAFRRLTTGYIRRSVLLFLGGLILLMAYAGFKGGF